MTKKLPKDQIEKNFSPIDPLMTKAEAKVESNRCLFCYDAPCTRACPTHIDVPSFIRKIATDNLKGAARVIFDANPIGSTCARVCPVEALCEGACVEKTLVEKPIEIGRLQRYATEHVTTSGKHIFEAGEPNGMSVAIVGSGPAGLSCATYLARLGYKVTIYEKKPLAGGLDTYGMAEYKMTQKDSLAEVALVESLGVEIVVNTAVAAEETGDRRPETGIGTWSASDGHRGSQESEIRNQDGDAAQSSVLGPQSSSAPHHSSLITHHSEDAQYSALSTQHFVSFEDLCERADAVFLGIGLGDTNDLNIPGEDLEGVIDALSFIERVKTRDWESAPLADTVAVIGAGNTAIDAVTQAKRLGAKKVMMVYRRGREHISAYDYEYDLAKKDGIEFVWHASPVGIEGNGRVEALRCRRNDGSDEEYTIPCGMVIKAIGQQKQGAFFGSIGLETDEKGRVKIDINRMTSRENVFAGGDCVNGGKEAVDASQAGKLAAMAIHEKLTGETVSFAGAGGLLRISRREEREDTD
ncbi:MAG: NAD(P)-dependent oxidoreductase [Acidobacteriota bacterium]|nr:MAG: NAD(P)-dependent oxidoreductase [Acidobacteriota bacterium]